MTGVVLGALAGAYRGRWIDRGISGLALFLYSMPPFWIGIMLILVMALQLRLLPSAGTGTPAHIVLPALTLAAPFTALLTRITRSSVADTMAESYVQRSYAKGLSTREVVTGHVVRNAATPVVTVGALHVSTLLGGAVIVESVFTWPGLGSLLVTAVANRDYSIVQAAVLLIAVIVVCCNVAADLIAARLDPRVRLGGPAHERHHRTAPAVARPPAFHARRRHGRLGRARLLRAGRADRPAADRVRPGRDQRRGPAAADRRHPRGRHARPARHRRGRPGHARPARPRRQDVDHHRRVRGGRLRRGGAGLRHPRRLPGGLDRRRDLPADRHPDGLPRHPAGDRHRRPLRAQHAGRGAVAVGGRLGRLRPAGPRHHPCRCASGPGSTPRG
ncbi:ABC transporter permease [Nonomuraea salmonea]|uniref:ABC transporter permease n=1 Tax=Nonomuraea salmonea TaxID=46181 RepID=UPI0031EB2C69